LGLSLFGWGYLFLVFGPWFRADSSPRPPALLTTKLLGYMHPMLSKTVTLPGSGSGTTPFLVTTVYGGSPPVTVIVPSWDQFQQVGHSLLALIIALVGGVLARYCYVIRSEIDQRTGSPPA
jgi:hypothetical protein